MLALSFPLTSINGVGKSTQFFSLGEISFFNLDSYAISLAAMSNIP